MMIRIAMKMMIKMAAVMAMVTMLNILPALIDTSRTVSKLVVALQNNLTRTKISP